MLARIRDTGRRRRLWALAGAALLAAGAGPAAAQDPAAPRAPAGKVSIELNKLEDEGGKCRAYFVLVNESDTEIGDLQMDLYMFDTDGIVSRRVALNTRQMRPRKTNVRLFDLTDQPCASLGRLVVNEVIACTDADGGALDCADTLALSSRAGIELVE